ncbi:ankyrin repeat-containing protein [Ilyonectria destructans]|nr:ankyrin repeat-containing protein [Ilyonectria destructans]
MRLLHTQTLRIEEFGGSELPLYAIFSHKWDANEVTMQDMQRGDANQKLGYKKVFMTCEIAKNHGFDYVWIDTCCIDKTSSAELSEAINSMYRWYQEATVCYAYLADVPSNAVDKFSKSAWFTRGWTLQELIAPSIVIFLDDAWQEIGTKKSLQGLISKTTDIPATILQGADLESASVAEKMSWASRRKTSRVEDLAYCLMGIFGVNMPMLYGEGERAFIRLQEEILKISNDYTLFAWYSPDHYGGLLATSPTAFLNSSKIVPLGSPCNWGGAIIVNNEGIHLNLCFIEIERPRCQPVRLAILPCTVRPLSRNKVVGIYLEDASADNEHWKRVKGSRLEVMDYDALFDPNCTKKSICVRQERRTLKGLSSLVKAAGNGHQALVKLLLEKGADPDWGLWVAIENGHEAVVKLLLENGADLNRGLRAAVENGPDAVVKMLLEKSTGADRISRAAARNWRHAVVKLLLEQGFVFDIELLRAAAGNGHGAIVKLLLDNGTGSDTKSLWAASENGYEEVVRLLLEKSLDSGRENMMVLTNYWGGEVKLVEDIDIACYKEGLRLAAKNGHQKLVKLFCGKGVKPSLEMIEEAQKSEDEAMATLLYEGAWDSGSESW